MKTDARDICDYLIKGKTELPGAIGGPKEIIESSPYLFGNEALQKRFGALESLTQLRGMLHAALMLDTAAREDRKNPIDVAIWVNRAVSVSGFSLDEGHADSKGLTFHLKPAIEYAALLDGFARLGAGCIWAGNTFDDGTISPGGYAGTWGVQYYIDHLPGLEDEPPTREFVPMALAEFTSPNTAGSKKAWAGFARDELFSLALRGVLRTMECGRLQESFAAGACAVWFHAVPDVSGEYPFVCGNCGKLCTTIKKPGNPVFPNTCSQRCKQAIYNRNKRNERKGG